MNGATHSMPATRLPTHLHLRLGQDVHVNHRESWHAATVTALAARSVQVSFATGFARAGFAPPVTVNPWVVRPADGMTLRRVTHLAAGDQIALHTTTQTLAAPPYHGRDGWMVLAFTGGGHAVVPAGAVLRVLDDTPAVTINGLPLRH